MWLKITTFEERDPFKFRIATLTAESYRSRYKDMDILLMSKGLCKYVGKVSTRHEDALEEGLLPRDGSNELPADIVLIEEDVQKNNLVLACVFTCVDGSGIAMVRGVRCLRKAWNILKEAFRLISESSINAKISQLQIVPLKN